MMFIYKIISSFSLLLVRKIVSIQYHLNVTTPTYQFHDHWYAKYYIPHPLVDKLLHLLIILLQYQA